MVLPREHSVAGAFEEAVAPNPVVVGVRPANFVAVPWVVDTSGDRVASVDLSPTAVVAVAVVGRFEERVAVVVADIPVPVAERVQIENRNCYRMGYPLVTVQCIVDNSS